MYCAEWTGQLNVTAAAFIQGDGEADDSLPGFVSARVSEQQHNKTVSKVSELNRNTQNKDSV